MRSTSFELTDAIADFYKRNPDLTPPKKHQHGYAVPLEIKALLEDMTLQIKTLTHNKRSVPDDARVVVATVSRNSMRREVFAYYNHGWHDANTNLAIGNAFTYVMSWREKRTNETELAEVDPESLDGMTCLVPLRPTTTRHQEKRANV